MTGRNSVLEALRTKTPSSTLYIASRIEVDDRVKEILALANHRGVPIIELMRPELDRITGHDSVHQGVALKVPAYQYAVPEDIVEQAFSRDQVPLLVALDGITDPRNLGAIIRSTAAFGGHGVIVPQRRSVGVTASAWKTSAGAAARTPVAMAPNLTQTLKSLKSMGLFVLGLDGDGDVELDGLELADRPIVIVVGSEGKGLSRLVTETCDAIVSIPISSADRVPQRRHRRERHPVGGRAAPSHRVEHFVRRTGRLPEREATIPAHGAAGAGLEGSGHVGWCPPCGHASSLRDAAGDGLRPVAATAGCRGRSTSDVTTGGAGRDGLEGRRRSPGRASRRSRCRPRTVRTRRLVPAVWSRVVAARRRSRRSATGRRPPGGVS